MAESPHAQAEQQPTAEGVKRPQALVATEQTVPAFQGGRIDPRCLTPRTILALQRTAGNRAVNSLLRGYAPPLSAVQRDAAVAPSIDIPATPEQVGASTETQPDYAKTPKVKFVVKYRHGADGAPVADTTRMRVGELLIVSIALDHGDPRALRDMGYAFVTSGLLTKESFAVDDGGVIQVGFRAAKIGAEHAEVQIIPSGTAPGGELVIPLETHVEMSQEDFRGQLQQAGEYKVNAYTAADAYMLKVGKPYRAAWMSVKETLVKASEPSVFDEIVVGLILTFFAALPGGAVVEAAETLKLGAVLTEGLKELTIHAAEKGLEANLPKPSLAFPPDPADWIDACKLQFVTEALAVGAILEEMIKANNKNRTGFFRDFDPVDAVQGALTFKGQPMHSLDSAAVPAADDFEKAIWKGWLQAYGRQPLYKMQGLDEHAMAVINRRLDAIDADMDVFSSIADGANMRESKE